MSKPDDKKKKSTETEELSLDDMTGVSGGRMTGKIMKKPACTTGLMSTCRNTETIAFDTDSCC